MMEIWADDFVKWEEGCSWCKVPVFVTDKAVIKSLDGKRWVYCSAKCFIAEMETDLAES